jgi:hypothetical protein
MFRFLFGPRNPTREWQRADGLSLTIDLNRASINDVLLGQPLNRLSFLGRDELRGSFRDGSLNYLHFLKNRGPYAASCSRC